MARTWELKSSAAGCGIGDGQEITGCYVEISSALGSTFLTYERFSQSLSLSYQSNVVLEEEHRQQKNEREMMSFLLRVVVHQILSIFPAVRWDVTLLVLLTFLEGGCTEDWRWKLSSCFSRTRLK